MHVFIRKYLNKLYYTSQTCLRREEGRCSAHMAAIRGSHSWFSSSACGVGLVPGRVSAPVIWECKDLLGVLACAVALSDETRCKQYSARAFNVMCVSEVPCSSPPRSQSAFDYGASSAHWFWKERIGTLT